MTSILTAAALVLLSADTLTGGQMGNLAFKAPSDWTRTTGDEGTTWETKEKNAKLELSVYPVDPKRDAALCLKQLLEALASDGWAQVKVGNAPAAWKAVSDFVGEGDAAKVDKNKVTTVTYVGCNGDTKWVLTMTSPTPMASRFGPLLKRMVESMKYGAPK
jgi:hypothetical protein